MTRGEALAEARMRWGPRACAWVGRKLKSTPRWHSVSAPVPRNPGDSGSGGSWKAAFADADRRAVKS